MRVLAVLACVLSGAAAFMGPSLPSATSVRGASPPETRGGLAVLAEPATEAGGMLGSEGDSYVKCGKCNAMYLMTEEEVGGGKRMKCAVCSNTWFQSRDRLLFLSEGLAFKDYPDSRKDAVQLSMAAGHVRPGADSTCFVGNLPYDVGEEDLLAIFSSFGTVGHVSIVTDTQGMSRGFGFVELQTREESDAAIEALNQATVKGRQITVRKGTQGSKGGGGGRGPPRGPPRPPRS